MSISRWLDQATPEPGRTIGIHPALLPGDQLRAELWVDQLPAGQFECAGSGGPGRVPAFEFALPATAVNLTIRGSLRRARGPATVYSRRWQLLRLGCLTAALYQAGSLASGVLNLARRLQALSVHAEGAYRSPLRVSMMAPRPHAAFVSRASAEVGPLPDPLVDLARLQIRIGGGEFLAPLAQRVTEGLGQRGLLGRGEAALLPWLSPATRARYQRSLLVFLDQSAGLALGWDPKPLQSGEATGSALDRAAGGAVAGGPAQGLWFWICADSIDEPVLLLNRDRTACTAELALRQVFERQVVHPRSRGRRLGLADYLLEAESTRRSRPHGGLLVVDAARAGDNLCLSFDDSGNRPQLRTLDPLKLTPA